MVEVLSFIMGSYWAASEPVDAKIHSYVNTAHGLQYKMNRMFVVLTLIFFLIDNPVAASHPDNKQQYSQSKNEYHSANDSPCVRRKGVIS